MGLLDSLSRIATDPQPPAQLMSPEDLPLAEQVARAVPMRGEMPLAPGDIAGLLRLLKSARFNSLVSGGVNVPTQALRGVARGNVTQASKVDDLAGQIGREGQKEALSISVDKAGRPFVGEGNHRLDAIRQLGLPESKISITPNVADDTQQFMAFLKALGL